MGVYIGKSARLPSEYQEVEYIGRNGNNYIDTGWVPKLTSPFEVKVGCKISTSGVRYGVLSNYNGTSGEAGLTSLEINDGSHTNNVLRFYSERTSGSNSANIYSSNTLNLSSFNDIVYTNNGSSSGSVTLNGITTNGSVKTNGYSNLTAYLFIDRALRWSTYSNNSFISYCKIYENGTLVRDFVPCYRISDSVIGLYDLVNNQFYTNAGTGTFSKGEDVLDKIDLVDAYIGRPDWTPGSNTLLYLPLEEDVVDKSGKTGRTFTTSGITYTTVGGVKSAHIGATGGAYLTAPNPLASSSIDKTKQTISVLYYVTSQTSSTRRTIVEFSKQGTEYFNLSLKENTTLIQYSDVNSWFGSGTTIVANQWNNVIVTADTTTRNIYINGQLAWSGSAGSSAPRGSRPSSSEQAQGIFCNRGASYAQGLNGNARELIIEDKMWSANDVAKYYNYIINKLGIS